jgi:hypothetical protein
MPEYVKINIWFGEVPIVVYVIVPPPGGYRSFQKAAI